MKALESLDGTRSELVEGARRILIGVLIIENTKGRFIPEDAD